MPTFRHLVDNVTPVQVTPEPYAITAMISVVVEGSMVVRLYELIGGGTPTAAEVLANGVAVTSASTFQLQDLSGRRPDFLWLLVDDPAPSATASVGVAW